MTWDPLDVRLCMFGVFWNEDYSADPTALFRLREDAEAWIAASVANPDEDERVPADHYSVCEVYRITGIVWNSVEPTPSVIPEGVEP